MPDSRPTKAQFNALALTHRKALLEPTHDGEVIAPATLQAFRAARQKRRRPDPAAALASRKVKVPLNGQSNPVQPASVPGDNDAA